MVVDMRLGLDNKRKAMHKAADAVTWTYAEGKLSYRFLNEAPHTLTVCDTLALENLLYAHYDEIVREARKEQRHAEDAADRRKRSQSREKAWYT